MGPKAPKDPTKQKPFFYIMKQKEIYGSKSDDGRGIQYLYQSDGRLESSAGVVGGVDDPEIIKLLSTVEGFRRLVHSIGVSVQTQNPEDEVDFIFQMYGKIDLYGGGTNLTARVKGNGSEEKILFEDVSWQPDDDIPGQIRFEMDIPDKKAEVSVRLYLNDGYEAPEQEEDLLVDRDSAAYKSMIGKSLYSIGNTARIEKLIDKSRRGERVEIAYIGGSITQGAGATPINSECYARKSFDGIVELLKKNGARGDFHYIKAGVGGTPSELGMIRFDRDVLRGVNHPDLVVVEFAVNDAGDETEGDCYESLVRKILALEYEPAVILLFSVFADDYNLQDRVIPVGKRYELPMISVKDAVTWQFYDKPNRLISKNQFFYDMFHPTNLGHTVMSDCIVNLFDEIIRKAEGNSDTNYDPGLEDEAVIGKSFDNVILMDKKDSDDSIIIEEGGFVYTDEVLQGAEFDDDLFLTFQFPYNWMYDGSKSQNNRFRMKLECKALLLVFKDSGEVDAARATCYVDGRMIRVADPYENRWLHCNPIILINEADAALHEVEIVVNEEDIDKKFTILGFGIVK